MKASIIKTPLPVHRKTFSVVTKVLSKGWTPSPFATKNLHKNVIKNPE